MKRGERTESVSLLVVVMSASVLKGIYAKRHICKKAYTYIKGSGVLCSGLASYVVNLRPMQWIGVL